MLQAVVSLLLLAFYHPALLAFDLVLLGCIAFVLFGLGRGGVDTAIKESKVKHQTGAWLQQLASSLVAFKGPRAAEFAFQRTDAFARSYVGTRAKHFRVLLRQLIASHVLQALATAALLGLGGALVIRGQLTLGQLVAAELAVTGVLASVAKSSKSLANYYDLNAAIDKLGSLIDLPSERRRGVAMPRRGGPALVALTDAGCEAVDGRLSAAQRNLSFRASHDGWLAVLGDDCDGRQTLVSLLYGGLSPSSGRVELDGGDIRNLSLDELRADVTLVTHANLFDGSVADNLSWGQPFDAGRARGEPSLPGAERLPAGFPAVPALEPLAIGADQRLARARRPEARALELQREQQQVERAWAENQLAPGFDVQVAVVRDFGPRSDVRPDLNETVVEASVLLDIPVQTRAQRGRVEAAAASAERLAARAQLAWDRIDADVRDAHSAIVAARDRIEATRREVALALELERGERARFEQGDSTLLVVNLREQQTAEALSRQVDALFDYFRARADIRAARGQ